MENKDIINKQVNVLLTESREKISYQDIYHAVYHYYQHSPEAAISLYHHWLAHVKSFDTHKENIQDINDVFFYVRNNIK